MDPIRPIPNTPFYINTDEETWDECRSHAENYHFDFASIHNQTENEDEPAGNWAWLDGTPWTDSTYTNWSPGLSNNYYGSDEHYLYLWDLDGTWLNRHVYSEIQLHRLYKRMHPQPNQYENNY